jgi:predicted phage baseplate assembly protein
MPLDVPNLDDQRWTDLVADATALIPRYVPLWTDHNVHDPGITFIELFAWLAEMQLYQLNRVGERHREVFGRLAGAVRRPLTPARVDVTVDGAVATSTLVRRGTQLKPTEGDDLVFETTVDVMLTRSRLRQVIADDGSGPIDHTEANEKSGMAFLAFGERAGRDAELRLRFDRFYPETESTLRLQFDLFTDDLAGRCGSNVPLTTDLDENPGAQSAELVWEGLGAGNRWRSLEVVADETYGLTRSGAVTLTLPDDDALTDTGGWIRVRIARGYFDIEPRLRHVGVNVLPCEQAETIQDQVLGKGNGLPNQGFEVTNRLVLDRASAPSVEVTVGGNPWTPVTSFDAAHPGSKVFMFTADDGRVVFGNGLNGLVPALGQEVRAVVYRTSAGRPGNVARNLKWKFVALSIPGVELRNSAPASGGFDPESLNDLELRARALLNRPNRAVTLNDIERLALGTPHAYVSRAYAIANCPAPERITVVVLPKTRLGRTGPPPRPSDAFLAAVNAHLQERRLIGDNLRVIRPPYVEVRVSARFRLSKGAGAAGVIERARKALDRFLFGENLEQLSQDPSANAALGSPCPTLWQFGRSVFPSEVYAALDGVAGIDAVSRLTLSATRDGAVVEPDSTGAIPVPRTGLAFAGAHDLAVETDVRRTG